MTTRLVTPWWLDRSTSSDPGGGSGSVAPTQILDIWSSAVRSMVAELEPANPIRMLQQAHRLIATRIRPVYAVDDTQPTSTTLVRGRGSCSQRLAILEAMAWDGETSTPEVCSACDLSATVRQDFGLFNSRDELFAQHGQTLCWGIRTLAGPVLGRWSAGASRYES